MGSGCVQGTGLVGRVLEDHVALLVLVLAQRDQDDVAVVDPDLFPELAADQAETLDAVEALRGVNSGFALFVVCVWPRGREGTYHGLESAVPQHLENLGVFLPFLLEGELTLLAAVFRVLAMAMLTVVE